jgi:hypothetical protein
MAEQEPTERQRAYWKRLGEACRSAGVPHGDEGLWELSDDEEWLYGPGGERIHVPSGAEDYAPPVDDEEPLLVVRDVGVVPASTVGLGYAARGHHTGHSWDLWRRQ